MYLIRHSAHRTVVVDTFDTVFLPFHFVLRFQFTSVSCCTRKLEMGREIPLLLRSIPSG